MITHNMKDAIAHGNRLVMMSEGRVILDIRGEEKAKLTVEDLLHKFSSVSQGKIQARVFYESVKVKIKGPVALKIFAGVYYKAVGAVS